MENIQLTQQLAKWFYYIVLIVGLVGFALYSLFASAFEGIIGGIIISGSFWVPIILLALISLYLLKNIPKSKQFLAGYILTSIVWTVGGVLLLTKYYYILSVPLSPLIVVLLVTIITIVNLMLVSSYYKK